MTNILVKGAAAAVVCLTAFAQDAVYDAAESSKQEQKGVATSDAKLVKPPHSYRIRVEFIDLAHTDLTRLLADDEIAMDDAKFRKSAMELVKQDKAQILETVIFTGMAGKEMKGGSWVEHIYPTEYEPAELPMEPLPVEYAKVKDLDPAVISTAPTPTAFEARDVGTILECICTHDPFTELVNIKFSAKVVQFVKNEIWAEWKDKRGDASIKMPYYYHMTAETHLSAALGQPILVSVLSPKNEEGELAADRKVAVFLHCHALGQNSK